MAKGLKTGGRRKGSLNKDSIPAEQLASELGVDPFEVLLRFAKGDWEGLGLRIHDITPSMRKDAASDATQYLRAKRTSSKVDVGLDSGMIEMAAVFAQMPKEELLRFIASEVKKINE